ncbi:hypothetical protein IKG31_02375 [Candidatus Saccharibacteria bacterium]|nr:hypothetical protein [Candidatus Saccharibacteria bacterium]
MFDQLKETVKKTVANNKVYKATMTIIPARASVEEIAQAILLADDYQCSVFYSKANLFYPIKKAILNRRIGHLNFWTACATHAIDI